MLTNTLYVSKDFSDYNFEEGSACLNLINELNCLFEDMGFTTPDIDEFNESKFYQAYLNEDIRSLKERPDDLTFILALAHTLDINFDLGNSYMNDNDEKTTENFDFNVENDFIEITNCETGEKENFGVDKNLLSEFIDSIKENY